MRVCLSSCIRYPTDKSHIFCATLYCHLWPVWLHSFFFSTLSYKLLNNWKKVTEHKMCFDIFYSCCLTNFSFQEELSGYRYSCQVLIILEFSRQIFEKSLNIKFHESPSSGSWVVPNGQTDWHDETDSHLPQFFANSPKNVSSIIVEI